MEGKPTKMPKGTGLTRKSKTHACRRTLCFACLRDCHFCFGLLSNNSRWRTLFTSLDIDSGSSEHDCPPFSLSSATASSPLPLPHRTSHSHLHYTIVLAPLQNGVVGIYCSKRRWLPNVPRRRFSSTRQKL